MSSTYIPEPLRKEVIARAGGCCEYCRVGRANMLFDHEIDHIIPEKHRGKTITNNLCYACFECNRHKGADFASFDEEQNKIVRLFNPRTDNWADHFRLDGATIVALTDMGRVTVFVLKLNDVDRIQQRAVFILTGEYPCSRK